MDDEFREDRIKGLEASVAFFSPSNKAERELWVAEAFLSNLGLVTSREGLIASKNEPPDVLFLDAKFEIKEIMDEGRLRHAEYKQELEDARSHRSIDSAFRHFRPKDLHVSQIYERCLAEIDALARKYDGATRHGLDLLFYVNLQHVFDVISNPFPDTSGIAERGWRSISFVKGHRSCCFFARADAPAFLQDCSGRLIHRVIK